jgi:hypothetical protein
MGRQNKYHNWYSKEVLEKCSRNYEIDLYLQTWNIIARWKYKYLRQNKEEQSYLYSYVWMYVGGGHLVLAI